jgi:hypothetical protein
MEVILSAAEDLKAGRRLGTHPGHRSGLFAEDGLAG